MPSLGITKHSHNNAYLSTARPGYLSCRVVRNHTYGNVYVSDAAGTVQMVPPTPGMPTNTVVIESLSKVNGSSIGYSAYNSVNGDIVVCQIDGSHLSAGVVNIPEAGLAIASEVHKHELGKVMSVGNTDSTGHDAAYARLMYNSGKILGAAHVNIHNPSINSAWMVIDDCVVPIPVYHDKQRQEGFDYCYRTTDGKYCADNVPFKDYNNHDIIEHMDPIGDKVMVYGLNKDKLVEYVNKKKARLQNSRTRNEVEELIRVASQEKQNENDLLRKELALMKAENQLLKTELSSAKTQLAAVNTKTAQTIEQQQLEMKLNIARQEANNLLSRNALDIERQTLSMNVNRDKANMDKSIYDARVQKEQLSVANTRAGTASTVVKAAAAAIPAAVGAAIWVASHTSPTASIAKTLLQATPTIARGVSKVVTTAASLVGKTVSNVASVATGVASSLWSGAKSVASGIADAVSSAWDWLTS